MKKFYLTTPIYYVNDFPHIGHAYTTVAADVLARWHRLNGSEVLFLTGTDEHGQKIAQAAAKNNESPKQFCDKIVDGFQTAWKELHITNDRFIRTTDPAHERAVQLFLDRLFKAGAIYKSKYEGLYCVGCEKFLAPEDLNQDLCCPDHRTKPVQHSEENYFFKLSAYRDQLIEILTNEKHPQHLAIYPVERRNEIVGKLKVSLEDISISRAALEWGIPLPFDPKQTAYVWIDALLNYISAIGYETDSADFKKYWPADLHLMAKDILWFHSVVWPAMLLASNLPLPKKVFAHGFFTIDGQKMSKSIGNVIRPDDLIAQFGVEPSRYLVLSLFPFGTDGDISWNGLTEKYNTDLANNLGNLTARSLTMVEKYAAGVTPAAPAAGTAPSALEDIRAELAKLPALIENLEFHRYTATLQSAINRANRYIEETAPWKMAKENNPNLPAVLYNLLANLKAVPLYLIPFMPETAQKIWEQLGETGRVEEIAARYFRGEAKPEELLPVAGIVTKKGGVMFPRIMKK